MSDRIQTIVDPEASATQALLSGARIWTWLVDEQIVGGAVVDVVGPNRIPGERAGAWLGETRQLRDLVSGTYGDVFQSGWASADALLTRPFGTPHRYR